MTTIRKTRTAFSFAFDNLVEASYWSELYLETTMDLTFVLKFHLRRSRENAISGEPFIFPRDYQAFSQGFALESFLLELEPNRSGFLFRAQD
jgi:hypothetical protein